MANKKSLEELTLDWVGNPKNGEPYYRPYLSQGNTNKASIFILGINPATTIYKSEKYTKNEFARSLSHPEEFYEKFYSYSGSQKTRMGINSLVKKIYAETCCSVIETNINAYPTPEAKDLKNPELREQVSRGYEISKEVFEFFKPKLVIVHGKTTLEYIKNFVTSVNIDVDKIEHEMYPNAIIKGHTVCLAPCRHLMLYGKVGNSFNSYTQNLIKYIKDNLK